MATFEELKKMRGNNSINKLQNELEKLKKKREEDTRFWKLTRDTTGNGAALIRFLPAPGDEDLPFVRYYSHGFEGPNGWYIENSLTTLDQPDPAQEYVRTLYKKKEAGDPIAESILKSEKKNPKRKTHFVSNILMINDPNNPENNGKVFLFKYGTKIYDKWYQAMNPEVNPLTKKAPKSLDPFCPWLGANFLLRIRDVDSKPSYDLSAFELPSPIAEDDDAIKKVLSE